MNVLDFKKDMGLWHGVLSVSVTNVDAVLRSFLTKTFLAEQ